MKSISTILILSVANLGASNINSVYASVDKNLSFLKSGISTLHLSHTHIRHTIHRLVLSSHLFERQEFSASSYKVASVCFITDGGRCGGNKFGNMENPNGGGNPDDHGTPEELCQEAGYTNEPCPEGSSPTSYCPYDSSYHSACGCSADYNQTCDTSIGEQGKGEACGGKYKECCKTCDGYNETQIPEGYVSIGECDSCDGKRYKIKCNPEEYVTSTTCGTFGGSGNTCQDEDGLHYSECKCPNNYEWSDSQKQCVCASSFQYNCQGTGYEGGEGNSCNNKYTKCTCAKGYEWNAVQGACVCNGSDFCTVNQDCSSMGYSAQSCEGQSLKCPFNTNYVICID